MVFFTEEDKAESGRSKFKYEEELYLFYVDTLTSKEYCMSVRFLSLEFVKYDSFFIKLHGEDWSQVTKTKKQKNIQHVGVMKKYKFVHIPIKETIFSSFLWHCIFNILIYKMTPVALRNTDEYINLGKSTFLRKKVEEKNIKDKIVYTFYSM